MLAVGQTGDALQFASPELCADKDVVLKALGSTVTAVQWVDPSLLEDPDVMKAQGSAFPILPLGLGMPSIPDAPFIPELAMPSMEIPEMALPSMPDVSIFWVFETFQDEKNAAT